MNLKVVFACASSVLILTGCYTAVATVATIGVDKSKYRPLIISTSDIDAWEATAKEANRQVVKDKLGTYYFDVESEGFKYSYISAKDGEVLRNLFSGEVGLLEPIYVWGDDLKIRPDWKETERRHGYLTNTIKLKLLPISASRKYHDLVEQKAYAADGEGGLAYIGQALRANIGLYDSSYYSNVIQKVPGKYSYFIASMSGAGGYYFQVRNEITKQRSSAVESPNNRDKRTSRASEPQSRTLGPMAYRSAANSLRDGHMLHFALVEGFKDLQAGGMNFLADSSSCGFVSPQDMRKRQQAASDASNVPYASGINMALKERDPEELRMAKAEFIKARTEVSEIMRHHEISCLGLREIGVSGRISSQKLD